MRVSVHALSSFQSDPSAEAAGKPAESMNATTCEFRVRRNAVLVLRAMPGAKLLWMKSYGQ
jgi:hypothetical protein